MYISLLRLSGCVCEGRGAWFSAAQKTNAEPQPQWSASLLRSSGAPRARRNDRGRITDSLTTELLWSEFLRGTCVKTREGEFDVETFGR